MNASLLLESPEYVFSSCKEIRDADNWAASGEYTIRTNAGRILDKVVITLIFFILLFLLFFCTKTQVMLRSSL